MERQFGPYTLLHQIAVGGMAEIYLARTEGIAGFEKYVAIKMIHPNFSEDQQFVQMLIDEAKISVQLAHVNIAQVFDLGRVGDTYYITMEFVEGCDLYQLLRTGSEKDIETPIDVAAFIAKEAATGLDYAHRKRDVMGRPLKIVHRDVSPQNLLVSSQGEVKVIDFGIAKASLRAQETQAGVIKGKYYYMSPEQAWGENLDPRTDLFSVGIILYELLTGQMLYLEEDLHTLLDMVRKADIAPPTTLRRNIPDELQRICMRALQKRPNDRYPSAGEMAMDLERFLHNYSPMFSANNVTEWTTEVLGNTPSVLLESVLPERDLKAVTQGFGNTNPLAPDDFTDENSIIFRVPESHRDLDDNEELEDRDPSQETGIVDPSAYDRDPDQITGVVSPKEDAGVMTRPARARVMPPSRPPARPAPVPLPELFSEEEGAERTIVSGPPGFGGAPSPLEDLNDFDPEQTLPHAPAPLVHQIPPPTPQSTAAKSPAPPARPAPPRAQPASESFREESTIASPKEQTEPVTQRREWQRNNPLSAANQKPAVSVLKPPRKSRQTPPQGSPNSVLSHLLTNNNQRAQVALSENSHTDAAQPARGTGSVPLAQRPPDEPPRPHAQQLPPGDIPYMGGNTLQGGYAPPPMGKYGQQGFPQMPQMATSAQIAAYEVDELPEAYRLSGSRRQAWILPTIGFFLLAVAAAAAGYYLFTQKQTSTAEVAEIVLVSIPEGATVKVDGTLLAKKTPTTYSGARVGDTISLVMDLEGYKISERQIRVEQANPKILARLDKILVSLTVTSEPVGAEVYLNGSTVAVGRTPLPLTDIDPSIAAKVTVKKEGYRPVERTLDWTQDPRKIEHFLLGP